MNANFLLIKAYANRVEEVLYADTKERIIQELRTMMYDIGCETLGEAYQDDYELALWEKLNARGEYPECRFVEFTPEPHFHRDKEYKEAS